MAKYRRGCGRLKLEETAIKKLILSGKLHGEEGEGALVTKGGHSTGVFTTHTHSQR